MRHRSRIEVTGVPVRRDLSKSDRRIGLDWIRRGIGSDTSGLDDKPVLLVLGGSQGARRINELVENQIENLCRDWIVVHQTGGAWKSERRPGYLPVAYLGSEYPNVLAAADCIVSRAGATTLWEAASLAKAMVLIPLGTNASRGDQIRNADYFESRGGAISLNSNNPDVETALCIALHRLATNFESRRNLGRTANEIIVEDSDTRVAESLLSYL